VVADVNQAAFLAKGSTYRVSHPAETGDRGTVFAPAASVLNDVIREFDPLVDDRPDQPFPFVAGPCDPDVFWRHCVFVQRASDANAGSLDPLWAESTALQIVAGVIEATFARHRLPTNRRMSTNVDHADRVEAAKSVLASRFRERISLHELARAVHSSPFHLARVFQRRTGVPVHRYLNRLRLRASLERLHGNDIDLTALALELGFCSHSHFTDAFRREFGRPPSEVRRGGCGTIRELSKILKV
jgi:AraC-like DNA-binding protein